MSEGACLCLRNGAGKEYSKPSHAIHTSVTGYTASRYLERAQVYDPDSCNHDSLVNMQSITRGIV